MRTLIQQLRDALKKAAPEVHEDVFAELEIAAAIAAAAAAGDAHLAQPERGAVAWKCTRGTRTECVYDKESADRAALGLGGGPWTIEPLYTHPPRTEPAALTEAELTALINLAGWPSSMLQRVIIEKLRDVAREVEAHHGIGAARPGETK